jgi:hypothetical protein
MPQKLALRNSVEKKQNSISVDITTRSNAESTIAMALVNTIAIQSSKNQHLHSRLPPHPSHSQFPFTIIRRSGFVLFPFIEHHGMIDSINIKLFLSSFFLSSNYIMA